jgi:ABC-2 type transport system ATP-binding protein
MRGVRKRLAGQVVLDGLYLEVAVGECVALVGGNGAGKTTTLKILLDFQHGDAGEVRLFDRSSARTDARARLAFLPERFAPPAHLSGAEFLSFMGRLHGRSAPAEDLAGHLQALELDAAALSRSVRGYSKGMAQKLGLIACLASGKELLVLDEPMSGLDPKARILVRGRLQALHRAGHTILFTTHSLFDAEALCDRLAILGAGRVVFQGTPAACLERYGADSLEAAYLAAVDDVGATIPD